MSEKNKAILEEANAANAAGNYEGFLSFCADDTEWTFVGDKTLRGKEAVHHSYCDVWRFRGDKIVELKAFVIKTEVKSETGNAA